MSERNRYQVLDADELFKIIMNPVVPTTSQQVVVESDDEKEDKKDIKTLTKDLNYWKKFHEKELERLASASANLNPITEKFATSVQNYEDEMQFAIDVKAEEQETPELSALDRYQFDIPPLDLPIKNKREEILRGIEQNMFILVSANTGTGKSTQIPQYILEDSHRNKRKCNIVVTQPRKIAAISVAKRVAIERKCDVGTLVGYQIGLDKKAETHENADTRILYCTTGVLLQKLVTEKSLKKYTHVIIDEIHDRDINIDMLLIVIRRLVATTNPDVKVILMSATMNSEKISNYFKTFKPYDNLGQCTPAPVLELKVDRPFEVRINYLDDLKNLGAFEDIVDISRPGISDDLYKLAMKTFFFVIKKRKTSFPNLPEPSFLFFLPGIREIERFKSELHQPHEELDISQYEIIILHSLMETETFGRAYERGTTRKIILATNMAESSVTLPGVTFVFDFCLTKYNETDTSTGLTKLKLDWASKKSLEQRAGRVGRIENGQVIRLIYKESHYELLDEETKPEIQRVSLEFAVLKTKELDLGRPTAVLALALDPPLRKGIQDAIVSLKEIGALTRFDEYRRFTQRDGELTMIGKIMTKLPVDHRIAKLIILGYVFRCLNECIIMGLGFSSSKGIFSRRKTSSIYENLKTYSFKMMFANGSGSDMIAILNAFKEWQEHFDRKETDLGYKEKENERKWCEAQCLSMKNLWDLHREVADVKKRLMKFNLKTEDYFPLNNEKKIVVLKMCIAGAFYPNYFNFGGSPPQHDDFKEINNMNPCSSVYFKGMKAGRLGKIYEDQIIEILNPDDEFKESCCVTRVYCERNSEKVYVDFKSYNDQNEDNNQNEGDDQKRKDELTRLVPGEVKFQVYRALKARSLGQIVELQVMNKLTEIEFVTSNQLASYHEMRSLTWNLSKLKFIEKCIYPRQKDRNIPGRVTHFENCNRFFFQPQCAQHNLDQLNKVIREFCVRIPLTEQIGIGSCLFVKSNNELQRAKVMDYANEEDSKIFKVFLIDFGQCVEINREQFFKLNDELNENIVEKVFGIPPQCIECKLSRIIPSPISCPSGWTKECKKEYQNFIEKNKGIPCIRIYSFVDRVASVKLEMKTSAMDQFWPSLNEHLVNKELAITSDDSYSQLYDENARFRSSAIKSFDEYEDEFSEKPSTPPPMVLLTETLKIDGPISILNENHLLKLSRLSENCVVDVASVNSILIDPYPFNSSKKFLVAAGLRQSNSIHLSGTTIMPHVPGIAILTTLIFSPYVEIRKNSYGNRVANILAGLGGTESSKGITSNNQDHDMTIPCDIDIRDDELKNINKLRFCMSSVLNMIGQKGEHLHRKRDEAVCQIIKVLSGEKRILPPVTGASFEWKTQFTKEVNDNVDDKEELLYQKHSFINDRRNLSEEAKLVLKRQCDEFERLSENAKDSLVPKQCNLCNAPIGSSIDAQIHLLKKSHNDRLMQLRDNIVPM